MRARSGGSCARAALALMTLVGCGSRTGLEAPPPSRNPASDAGGGVRDASAAGDGGWALDAGRAHDAGLDARVDADASVVWDAGLDAGSPDSGRTDAGGMDAGDVPPVDGGAVDAHVPPADVGPPDAGPCVGSSSTWCVDRCTDLETDPLHCGACEIECSAVQVCAGGVCGCAPPTLACGPACVDPRTDPTHCGGCGVRCPPTATCEGGACTCPGGSIACGGRCIDPMIDPRNCGSCGDVCGIRCDSGVCLDTVGVSVGESHVSDGAVWCWGSSLWGQVGVISSTPFLRPTLVAGIEEAVAVAASNTFTCALRDDGTVWCWGSGPGVGTGDAAVRGAAPQRVAGLDRVIAIDRGAYYVCALRDDGSAYCWGGSFLGIFGDGNASGVPSAAPRRIPDVPAFVHLGAGGHHVCGVDAAGQVYCWGSNQEGQLGRGTESGAERPATVTGMPPAAQVAGGYWHTCALARDGRAFCWGHTSYGAIGDGTTGSTGRHVATAQLVRRSRSDFVAIDAGAFNACALTVTGEPWCWGNNQWGQLADGTDMDRGEAARVPGLSALAQVSTDDSNSCFRGLDGALRCSGWNLHGEVGDGTTTPQFVATPVAW